MVELNIGDTYSIARYEAVPIKKAKSGKYWMQMLGMTSGPWPGEGDISKYNNDDIAAFVAEFGDAIDHFRIPSKEEMMRVPGIYPALIRAAANYGYFWTGQDGSMVWLGTAYDYDHAYYVSSRGIVGNYNKSHKLDIAPAFNLDPSKVILNGKKIMLAPIPESKKKTLIVMEVENPENCNMCQFAFWNCDHTERFGCNAKKQRNFTLKEQHANSKPEWCPIVGTVSVTM